MPLLLIFVLANGEYMALFHYAANLQDPCLLEIRDYNEKPSARIPKVMQK